MNFIYGKFEYFNCLKTHIARDLDELKNILDIASSSENYFVGYVRYCDLENYKIDLGLDYKPDFKPDLDSKNLIYLAEFREFKDRKMFATKKIASTFAPFLESNLSKYDQKAYKQKIKSIKYLIKKGECYQVNFTHNLKVHTISKPKNIFYQLLQEQDTAYRAFMGFKSCKILSFSPELFFSIKDNIIKVKPMKGTMKRGRDKKSDKRLVNFLKNDEKNISENLMIVDLFRNDLNKFSHIFKTKLFNIEKYKNLFQMTSTIKSKINSGVKLSSIFEHLFPSGSITGAPKKSVIKNIRILEDERRGIYCGALGVVSRDEVTFSIPIRTLVKYGSDNFYTYGVGSGIVWDSDSEDEYRELLLKTKFLQNMDEDFFVFETCLLERGEIFLEDLHLRRLKFACIHFNIKPKSFNLNSFKKFYKNPKILKIKVYQNGNVDIEIKPLDSIKSNKIIFKRQKIKSDFAMFKTSNRIHLDSKKIQSGEFFDYIYFDKDKRLLEGARSNIVLQINDTLFTPKLDKSLDFRFLNGTFRTHLLKRGEIFEKELFLEDIKYAQKIFCINSLRKFVEVC